ncbi:histone-binding protein N1/N2 isoform X5 [Patella vulgata]|uniref:histone-binding protein N1/N2 isoform X5 n=1 Tax=Patella vulgata TaxID=6465 RepID=UPI00217F7A5E|nr:histone-binding protein N1/N2 isoform X5 [Patella vulgata]
MEFETLNDKKPEDDKKDDVDEEEIMEDEEDKEDEGDAAENEGEDGEGKTDEEDPEDVSNLQLAWEMLELAKMIYLKDSAKEAQLRAAQSYLKLGEVSLETERYEQAISDFKDCLQIQEKHLSPEDRLIAESHYQLGLAYGFNQQYDESIDHYRAAIKVIENKIGKLEQSVEDESIVQEKETGGFEDPVQQIKKEIEDLKEILPDIRSKIEDMVEDKKSLEQLKDITKEALGDHILGGEPAGITTTSSSIDTAKKASDISHLIRKKRKPDEDPEPDAESKKSRQEIGGSGDAKAVENVVTEKEAKDKTPTAMEEATTTS